MSRSAFFALLCIAFALPASGESPAPAAPDWEALADVDTIYVLTHDEDGKARETKIWLAVLDGQGFIRTGDTRWGDNVERDAELVLRIGDVDYPLRADFIEDEGLRERVEKAFHEKYGWSDGFIGIFRGGRPRIMHLLPR